MKKEFLPYYISRAVLCSALAVLVVGFTWKALLLAGVMFALMLFYLHGGWFRVDPSRPLFPLWRDARGKDIQRKALVAAVASGLLAYMVLAYLPALDRLPNSGTLALLLGVLVYFLTQFILFARA